MHPNHPSHKDTGQQEPFHFQLGPARMGNPQPRRFPLVHRRFWGLLFCLNSLQALGQLLLWWLGGSSSPHLVWLGGLVVVSHLPSRTRDPFKSPIPTSAKPPSGGRLARRPRDPWRYQSLPAAAIHGDKARSKHTRTDSAKGAKR